MVGLPRRGKRGAGWATSSSAPRCTASITSSAATISNPSLAFVGWLLLALALIPDGEAYALRPLRRGSHFRMPPILYWGAFFIAAAGYTASGLHKLTAPSWRDGSALSHVLSIPLARDMPWRTWLLGLDAGLLRLLTWGAVAAECAYLPLALFRRTRPWAWAGMVAMHLGILTVISFADLTFAMLVLHLFLWDPRWWSSRPTPSPRPLHGEG